MSSSETAAQWTTNVEMLRERALEAARRAYRPYSGLGVGAAATATSEPVTSESVTSESAAPADPGTPAVDSPGGIRVVTGCNVENASYGLTLCAERVALAKAVSEGVHAFRALAIAGGTAASPAAPCGACRQVLAEFCPPAMPVWYAGLADGPTRAALLGRLLPRAFAMRR